jgi:sec-independent protein translocase protein TatC
MSNRGQKLSVFSHLSELRKRLLRSVIAVAATSILAFVFYNQIFDILLYPAPQGVELQAIEMTEMLGTIMRVCLFAGIIVAIPYLTYELIMFVAPALTKREKRYVYFILPWIALMFAGGVAFGYFVLVPRVTNFLLTFGSEIATPQPRIGNYISVVTRLLLATGLVFELPVLTTFLARLGIVSPQWLASKRKAAIILAFILAAMITPTIDPINQSLVAVPLIILYEMSIWLAKLVYRRKEPAAELTSQDGKE